MSDPGAIEPDAGSAKVLSLGQLLELRHEAAKQGRRVVQCHGCFDIVHPGHIRHLRYAKGLGDVLLVTITGDAHVGKGRGRPLIPEELRADNLAALDFVDWVHVAHVPTAVDLLEQVRPDVYVKGREYEFNADPRFRAEREAVERHGGRVIFTSGDVVFSSTALIEALDQSVDPKQKQLRQLLEKDELAGEALYRLLADCRGRRVLVIGETITDTYVHCDRPDVAGEGPIMTLRPVQRRCFDGGAAIVARHLAAMGGRPVLVTPVPSGAEGEAFRHRIISEGVELRPIPTSRATPEKQRFLVGPQKVMKLDLVEPLVLDATQEREVAGLVDETARGCDAAIVADFGLGLFSASLLGQVCASLRREVDVLAGDVSGRRAALLSMRKMDLLCPSEAELREAFRRYDEGLPAVTWRLLRETRARSAIVTMGAEGIVAFDPVDGPEQSGWASRVRAQYVPALCPFAIDALGCGDALLAAATLALSAGGSLLSAALLGALAAATQAQRIGNIPVSATDLRRGVVRLHASHLTFASPDVIAGMAHAQAIGVGSS